VRDLHRERALEFLRPLDTVAETDSLVESGLIDSLAFLSLFGVR
jgi:hypothetical protein